MAGSWAGENIDKSGFYAGNARIITELSNVFTADASAATVPDWTFAHDCSFLFGFGAVFDGATPPDAINITIKDQHGLAVATATAVASSGRQSLTTPVPLINGGTVSIDGNTTNSAKAKIVLYVAPNYR